MSFLSSFCIGSYAQLSLQSLEVGGSDEVIPAGDYYLYDPVDALSLLAAVDDAMASAGVAGHAVVLLPTGRVRISAFGIFALNWGDPLLRDLLGFEADLAGAPAYTATLASPLFWSPGKPELSVMTPLGVRGAKQYNVVQSVATYSGTTESSGHGYREQNRFTWQCVSADRVRTVNELPGEFGTWFEQVAVTSSRWKLYHNAVENPSATSGAFTYDTVMGPYIVTLGDKGGSWAYDRSRNADWTDLVCDLALPVHVCPEYSS